MLFGWPHCTRLLFQGHRQGALQFDCAMFFGGLGVRIEVIVGLEGKGRLRDFRGDC